MWLKAIDTNSVLLYIGLYKAICYIHRKIAFFLMFMPVLAEGNCRLLKKGDIYEELFQTFMDFQHNNVGYALNDGL